MGRSVKCAKCRETVGKKTPGLQCSRCSKWLHSNGTCTSLTTEQLSALSATDSVDWKCKMCSAAGGKPKRLSVILPDPDDEVSETETVEQEKVLYEIHNEVRGMRTTVREIIREELQKSLKFYSDKIDDYEIKLQDYESRVKLMENQLKHVTNSYKNLELKNEVLEQKMSKIEQEKIRNVVEICGLKEEKEEDTKGIVNLIGTKLQQNSENILNAYRKKRAARPGTAQATRISKDSPITVILKDGCSSTWIDAAKNSNVTPADLGLRGTTGDQSRIYVRAALTPVTAYLLWKAKTELRDKSFAKYVWSKDGVVMARKDEESKRIYYVRSESDIESLKTKLSDT